MILEFNKFAEAVKRAEKFASDSPSSKNLLMESRQGKLVISFSDGKKNITERLECTMEDSDIEERAIVTFENVKEIITSCTGSGSIQVDSINLKFDGRDRLIAEADKYYLGAYPGEENKVYKKLCSHVNKEVKYTRVDDLKGGTILTRFDYDTIFTTVGESLSSETPADEWEVADLKELFARVSKNDPKTCFFSSKYKAAYSMTQASLTFVPIEQDILNGFSMASKVAKNLGEIINSIGGADTKIQIVTVDKKFCYMMNTEETFGIMFELAQATRNDVSTLQRYRSSTYDTYKFRFFKDALADTLKTALSAAKDDNSVLSFQLGKEQIDGKESDKDELQCVIDRGNASSSISKLVLAATEYTDNDEASILDLHIKLNLKVMLDIISNCTQQYVVFELLKVQNSVLIQISDVAGKSDDKYIISAYHYTACMTE